MTRLTGEWLTRPATQAVCAALTVGGAQALFVGGCVRNTLIGAEVSDIDIATDAPPERVIELAKAARLKPIPTGIDHGTVTLVSDGIPHEVTTFRRDVETDGRHAVVSFSGDISEDASRRDFTMNALYAKADGTLIDPLDGLPDLMARRVRFIGDARSRIREDFLRSLRYFRFHAWYGDSEQGLDAEALAAISTEVEGLAHVSLERIGAETLKLLSAPDPAVSIAAMRSTGVLTHIMPGSDNRALAPLVHLEQQFGLRPEPIRRLAALGGSGADQQLRLSKAQSTRLSLLNEAVATSTHPAELGYRKGYETALSIMLLRSALLEMPLDLGLSDRIKTGADAKFPVSANDLMPEYSGLELGQRLAHAEQEWIDSGFTATRADLLKS